MAYSTFTRTHMFIANYYGLSGNQLRHLGGAERFLKMAEHARWTIVNEVKRWSRDRDKCKQNLLHAKRLRKVS